MLSLTQLLGCCGSHTFTLACMGCDQPAFLNELIHHFADEAVAKTVRILLVAQAVY